MTREERLGRTRASNARVAARMRAEKSENVAWARAWRQRNLPDFDEMERAGCFARDNGTAP